jgi:non-specific protein-tyrosine kinase
VNQEGKTLTALNLAVAFSQEIDRTVLLVEVDLARPSFNEILGLDADAPGLVDHLLDNRPVEELLVRTNLDNLTILPAGRSVPNSAELLGARQMKKLVAELKERFIDRFIIFDTSPVTESADALVFSEVADAILLVVEAGRTAAPRIRQAQEILEHKNLIGLMLNKAKREPVIRRRRP